ncbi:MAG: FixH family protein [Burkholderiales bacterium]|nr:FixH family protein [Burkholderiales bacterium]
MSVSQEGVVPWYREPWPWLLMAGPAAVVVAGIATIWIAVVSSDGLVVDDYYKQGLAINQTLQRDGLAAQRGYRAEAAFTGDGRRVVLRMDAAAGVSVPDTLQLHIIHPTRAGRDGLVLLRRDQNGVYAGTVPALSAGRWILVLEDTQATWRLTGEAMRPSADSVILKPASL